MLMLFTLLFTLLVTPQVTTAPGFVRVRVQADAGEWIAVEVDGTDYYRESTEPRAERRTHTFEFRDIPTGEYAVTAYAVDSQGRVLSEQRRPLTVN